MCAPIESHCYADDGDASTGLPCSFTSALLLFLPCIHAHLQSALSKERRELQQQQQRTLLEAIPKDLSRPWEDPMPEEGERHLAAVCGETALVPQAVCQSSSYHSLLSWTAKADKAWCIWGVGAQE